MTANKKALAVMKESLQSPPSKSKFLAVTHASRLKMYSTLAAASKATLRSGTLGVLAGVGVSVEAFAGLSTVTASINGNTSSSADVFSAAGIDFQIWAFQWSNSSYSMGLQIANADRAAAGEMQFWSAGTQPKLISANATGAGLTNRGFGGSAGGANLLGTGETGSDRNLGFLVQGNPDGNPDYVAGWINFDFDRTVGIHSFTLNDYSFNSGNASTSIMMPANASAVPEPSACGLALLALGAMGVRRRRATNN